MKILIDARLYGLENAGLGRYLINLIEGLSKLDHTNNYVILLRDKYFRALSLPHNWKKIRADFHHYSFAEQIKLPWLITKEDPDITHFPHFNVPILYTGKYIVTIHDMLMHKSIGFSATTLPAPLYLLRRLGYRIAFDIAVKRARVILAPSEAVKNELIEIYKIHADKVKVTYEGFDLKIASNSVKKLPEQYFIYTGNAYPHKNIQNLLKAIKTLNTKSKQKIFLVISSARNIFTQRVEKMVKTTGLVDYVKLLGFVPDNELGSLYRDSIAYVSPSFSEGFGLPGLEALASKTLLLASDIPVYREVYQDQATYFDPYNPDSIAEAMQSVLLITPEVRKKRISRSIEFVKKYSWDKMAKETLNVYESCNNIRSCK